MTQPITIVGGLYRERCAFPRQDLCRGSGGRAALLLRSCGATVRLVTAADEFAKSTYAAVALPRGISLEVSPRPSITFEYAHPLASPTIIPAVTPSVTWLKPVESEKAIAFGMLEGRPPLRAQQVVYDPQDGFKSQLFSSNGSFAERLVYVLNSNELQALSGESSLAKGLGNLRETSRAEAIVVKMGARGVLVSTEGKNYLVDSWPTRFVWKIGSGDVFTAAFGASWLEKQTGVLEAAKFASRAVAEYVYTQADFFSEHAYAEVTKQAHLVAHHTWNDSSRSAQKRVYLAAPFFTTSQQWLVDEIKSALEDMEFEVFSPIHAVGQGPATAVATADLDGLRDADFVFAVMDGCDSGTLFELGWATAHKKKIVCLLESPTPHATTMVEGTGAKIFSDLTSAVYALAWMAMDV